MRVSLIPFCFFDAISSFTFVRQRVLREYSEEEGGQVRATME